MVMRGESHTFHFAKVVVEELPAVAERRLDVRHAVEVEKVKCVQADLHFDVLRLRRLLLARAQDLRPCVRACMCVCPCRGGGGVCVCGVCGEGSGVGGGLRCTAVSGDVCQADLEQKSESECVC